ncbi:hypothetical protein KDC22_11755 [Paenibacillus tritici]|uniref:hypothetical protein n=1 Tax=Paenibacillus tritici TaxID=1873425 RepID=UPI001BA5B417|nr:hypothetical protein [Paenibacillus tritici]QUL57081.1 hypothetical protein KDC22_11755 [Paenibacillus tritici]
MGDYTVTGFMLHDKRELAADLLDLSPVVQQVESLTNQQQESFQDKKDTITSFHMTLLYTNST